MKQANPEAFIAAGAAHLKNLMATPRKVEIPELDMEFWIFPKTLAEDYDLLQIKDDLERVLDMIMVRATDADGKPVFPNATRSVFATSMKEQLSAEVIYGIVARITEQDAKEDDLDENFTKSQA